MEDGYDPAPFITFKLTDNEATRQVYPHKFELLYKVGGSVIGWVRLDPQV